MEIAGLAVGIAGLAGLFSACMESIERIESYRNFGHDSRHINDRFDADKLLFQRWATEVGISGGKLQAVHHVDLDNAAVLSMVQRILSQYPRSLQMNYTDRKRSEDQPSKRGKIVWALKGKAKFIAQVELFGNLVDKLYRLVPPHGPSKANVSNLTQTTIGNSLDDDWLAESQRVLHEMGEWLQAEIRREIERWLGATRTDQFYDECLLARLPGTCDWILGNSAYLNWVSSDFPSDTAKYLWIHGPAGYGKTVLCAKLIQHLTTTSTSPLAFFFFSSDLDTRGDPLATVRSWILQAIVSNQSAFQLALQYSKARKGSSASRNDIWGLFGSIISCIPNYTFVVDGLDECTTLRTDWTGGGGDDRKDFLKILKKSTANTRTRVLIVSRDEVDIRSEASPDAATSTESTLYEYKISDDDVQRDVILFSRNVVDRKLPNKEEALREDLATKMAEKCNGMFLWIKLQQENLRRGKNRKQLQEAINDMPIGLEHTYDRNWLKISRLPSRDRSRALALLRWVTFALRPLTVLEMTEALISDDDADDCEDLRIDELPDNIDQEYLEDEILGLCGSLLEIRATSSEQTLGLRTVQLAHFSVRQYLLSAIPETRSHFMNSIQFSNQAFQNNELGKACLRYLNYRTTWKTWRLPATGLSDRPFLDYATRWWYLHASAAGTNYHEMVHLVNRFFCPDNQCWKHWRTGFEFFDEVPSSQTYYTRKLSATPLYYASLFGLVDTMKFLKNQKAPTLMPSEGDISAVKFLVDSSADIELYGGGFGTAIHAAAALGHEDVTEYLVNAGANLLSKDSEGRTSLFLACQAGHANIVFLLLSNGSDMSVGGDSGWTPLTTAASIGHIEVVKVLLEKEADMEAADQSGWTPLNSAASNGHLEVVKALLAKGADATTPNDSGVTPLKTAAYNGHLEVVKLLLNSGAAVAAVEHRGWKALNLAAFCGHTEIVKSLLDKGANVNTTPNFGWTPLSLAVEEGHIDVVKLLLGSGADVTVGDNGGRTPLHVAVNSNSIDITRLLLDNGADATAADNRGRTPLHLAAMRGHTDIVKPVLDNEADSTAADDKGRSVLSQAVTNGDLDTIKLLLDKGADEKAGDVHGCTPLQIAAKSGSAEVAVLLLDRGVDVNATDAQQATALHYAVQQHNTSNVKEYSTKNHKQAEEGTVE
ncbi:MAG: hypothetical protein M1816_002319 [Peltula sp. TS41687]|nr:MAG: hypothetical protein M1816_002319 [Peltula sp. TS41687]